MFDILMHHLVASDKWVGNMENNKGMTLDVETIRRVMGVVLYSPSSAELAQRARLARIARQ